MSFFCFNPGLMHPAEQTTRRKNNLTRTTPHRPTVAQNRFSRASVKLWAICGHGVCSCGDRSPQHHRAAQQRDRFADGVSLSPGSISSAVRFAETERVTGLQGGLITSTDMSSSLKLSNSSSTSELSTVGDMRKRISTYRDPVILPILT